MLVWSIKTWLLRKSKEMERGKNKIPPFHQYYDLLSSKGQMRSSKKKYYILLIFIYKLVERKYTVLFTGIRI
jgi:hypothetical protein